MHLHYQLQWVIKMTSELAEFKQDVPNDRWLQEQIDYAKAKGINSFGVPYMGKVTGRFTKSVRVPVEVLATLKGQRGEHYNVRQNDLESLVKLMREEGEMQYAPYIEVAYDGSAWISEGNHRIMAANALGWHDLAVEIKYFDGGERFAENLSPERIIQPISIPCFQP